ncbi:hypothetical protein KEHDKFFH_15340 [Marinobacter maroccanus]|uniref:Uncharacterized protein n=1 Tax=Marinobacter maroccanus TaxID=2055143 RepID=A0A2S5Z7J1_9GAMM|nr:hypothetical protein [Marinobacter maroccanus]PPI83337.1 hypothetical protein KEHDKFFH_15340 [Marinobacter maroccanus]
MVVAVAKERADFETGWVKPPYQIKGLDHLGVQAPGIEIYGQLLPGITNVTDRARYYSFYAWLFWQFEQKGWRAYREWQPMLRKAECLFALIALHHGQANVDDQSAYSGAMVGSAVLSNALQNLDTDGYLSLSVFSQADEGKTRYFKNPTGGLGQYYFGSLWQLGIMTGDSVSEAKLVEPVGTELAKAMDAGVDGDAFMALLEADRFTTADLDALHTFCPWVLKKSEAERHLLLSILMRGHVSPPENGQDEMTGARSASLAYIYWLAGQTRASKQTFENEKFRFLVYTQANEQGEQLAIPPGFQRVTGRWQAYQRHELFSVALQGLFFSLLRSADLLGATRTFPTTRALCAWFWTEGPGGAVIDANSDQPFGDWVIDQGETLPDLKNWRAADHEMDAAASVCKLSAMKSPNESMLSEIVVGALRILTALIVREENSVGYGSVEFRPNYLDNYPVNIDRWQRDFSAKLKAMSVREALILLSQEYCLNGHIRVGLRKLRQQGQNTFRFEVTERGLWVKEIPEAVETSPRLAQSIRILMDLGVLEEIDGSLSPVADPLMEPLQ